MMLVNTVPVECFHWSISDLKKCLRISSEGGHHVPRVPGHLKNRID